MTWGEFKMAVEAKGVKDRDELVTVDFQSWWPEGWATDVEVTRRDPDDAVTIETA